MKLKISGRITMAEEAYLTRRVSFSAMHELSNPTLSDEENQRIFGKCFRTHGHNYFLEVTVRGPIDPFTGLCCDRDRLADVLKKEVVDRFNGTHLNHHFKSTTGEELAREFYAILHEKLKPLNLVSVRLQE